MRKFLVPFILIAIILLGLYFRLQGISTNHSFWSDEAQISLMARQVVQGQMSITQAVKIQDYQPLHIVVTAFAFYIFGVSEFSARLFPVIFGTLGILFAFLLTRKLSNTITALLAAFLYSFSHLNLAHSTQAKQYGALETIVLIEFYLLILLKETKNKKTILLLNIGLIALISIATLFHFLGVLLWITYFLFIVYEYRKGLLKIIKIPRLSIPIFLGGIILLYVFKFPLMIQIFFHGSFQQTFFPHNHFIYLIKLLGKEYGLFVIPATIAVFISYKKFPSVTLGVIVWSLTLLYLWSFKHYTHNVRYIVPFFGLLFVYFSVFWEKVGEYFPKNGRYIPLIIVVIFMVTGYKIDRIPLTYYNPNAELFADVQNADYKTAFTQLHKKYQDINKYPMYNDVIEPQAWYLDGKIPTALFLKDYTAGLPYGGESKHGATGIPIYTSLGQLQREMKKNPQGFVVVEDWESLLPEEIKQYAKKNLKREVRVEGLPEAHGDNWPIEIYSWGI